MGIDKNGINRCLGASVATLLAVFGVLLILQLSSTLLGPPRNVCTKKVCLSKFLEGPPAFNNEPMANYLRSNYFKPPSTAEYRLSGHSALDDNLYDLLQFIKNYFNNKRGGVFLDLGAGDGEYRSITLPLEMSLGWSGLLVEPHPQLYKKLLKKARKAESCNACVSPYSYPAKIKLSHPTVKEGTSEDEEVEILTKTKLDVLWNKKGEGDLTAIQVQCVPLENLVYAGGLSKIDLLVLDMSGNDLDILLNTKLDELPEIEMIVIRANGENISEDVSGYFLERNMVMKKVFGSSFTEAAYVLIKFDASRDL